MPTRQASGHHSHGGRGNASSSSSLRTMAALAGVLLVASAMAVITLGASLASFGHNGGEQQQQQHLFAGHHHHDGHHHFQQHSGQHADEGGQDGSAVKLPPVTAVPPTDDDAATGLQPLPEADEDAPVGNNNDAGQRLQSALDKWETSRRRRKQAGPTSSPPRGHLDGSSDVHPRRGKGTTRAPSSTATPTNPPSSTPEPQPTGIPPVPPLPPMPGRDFVDRSAEFAHDPAALRRYRRGVVIEQIEHSFSGYARCAWGADEVRPVSCRRRNWNDLGGFESPHSLGLSIIDAMTTLYVANLTDQWEASLRFVQTDLTFDVPVSVSVFEMIIRVVGGLLSAYEISGERHVFLLEKARDMADRLMPAFKTQSGLPRSHVHLQLGNASDAPWHQGTSLLAEMATNGLEFRTLSYHTRDLRYAKAANRVNQVISNYCSEDGLCHLALNTASAQWEGTDVSLGGLGDSYYEYLLKMFVHSGFEDQPSLARFLRAAASIHKDLFVFERDKGRRFEELVTAPGSPDTPRFVHVAVPPPTPPPTGEVSSFIEQPANQPKPTATKKPPATVTRHKAKFRRGYVAALRDGQKIAEMDHLVCFAAGMFELAYHVTPWDDSDYPVVAAQQSLPENLQSKLREMSMGLGRTCGDIANMTQFGLWPELTKLVGTESFAGGGMRVHHLAQPYLLRPEAFESFYYLTLFDLHPGLIGPGRSPAEEISQASSKASVVSHWEEDAWTALVHIIQACKVEHGFSGVRNVMQAGMEVPSRTAFMGQQNATSPTDDDGLPFWNDLDGRAPRHNDAMETFWIAETLKYALLTFSVDPASFTAANDGTDGGDDDDLIIRRAKQSSRSKASPSADDELTALQLALGVTSQWVLNTEAHPLRIRPDLFDRIPPL